MKIKRTLDRGYAYVRYEVIAEEGEILTKENVKEHFDYPFGCYVEHCDGKTAVVKDYTD